MTEKHQRAERLEVVTQRVGFTLWQLQELEVVAAYVFVLLAKAKKGMGEVAGNALLDKATGDTFGGTFRKMKKAGILPDEIESRFDHVLGERNWLVHRSRESSGQAIDSAADTAGLVQRINDIETEGMQLMRELKGLAERHVEAHGVTQSEIDAEVRNLVGQWQDAE